MDSNTAPWPSTDLEDVRSCPVCGNYSDIIVHENLTDRVFGTAPGTWTLKCCTMCASGYLDPRPTQASIGRAYAGYFTHSVDDQPIIRPIGRIRSALHAGINGFLNRHYKLRRSPASSWMQWTVALIPSLRTAVQSAFRHLPPLPPMGGTLLDVGCGNGDFLSLARDAGWTVEGVDFDSDAVRVAKVRGLSVFLGSIDVLKEHRNRYDVITSSHVIEHVHEPALFVRQLLSLLKPGGILWLETPNLASLGSRRFGRNWRGLEPPRHLVLFNRESLKKLLLSTGFTSLRQHWHGMSVFSVFASSEAISQGFLGMKGSYQGHPPWRAVVAELYEMLVPANREFLTFTARKPPGDQ